MLNDSDISCVTLTIAETIQATHNVNHIISINPTNANGSIVMHTININSNSTTSKINIIIAKIATNNTYKDLNKRKRAKSKKLSRTQVKIPKKLQFKAIQKYPNKNGLQNRDNMNPIAI